MGHALARVSLSERLGMVFGLLGFGEMERSSAITREYGEMQLALDRGDRLGRWTGVHLRERSIRGIVAIHLGCALGSM